MTYKAFINHFNISTPERHTLSFTLFKLIINHVNAVFIGGVITYLRKTKMKTSIILLGLTSLFASSVFAGGTFGG
ncbi:hypothetical protein FCV51_20955, partial [Vibrio kanaloae]